MRFSYPILQTAVTLQRAYDVVLARSFDLANAREKMNDMEESSVTMEVYSLLQKQCDDYKSRVQELELRVVEEESKVSAGEQLRRELEEKVRVAHEAEIQAKVEEAFLTTKVSGLTSDLEKMKSWATARVAEVEAEMEGMAMDALYLAWSHNKSMDLSFAEDPSILARFETRFSAEASAAAQAKEATLEGRAPEKDPIVVIEADVLPEASNVPL